MQIETFSVFLALCEGNSPVTGEFTSKRPVTWSFDDFYYLRMNETPVIWDCVRLVGAKPLSEPMMECCLFEPSEQISIKSWAKFVHFIQENAFENVVCEMAAILSSVTKMNEPRRTQA